LRGHDPKDPDYIPIGFAMGRQFNLIMTTEEMVKTKAGLRITELALAEGEKSQVR